MFAASKTAAVSSAANYIEDVFSTYLYTGNGSTQTITNGIDLSTKGGLFWMKNRGRADYHFLVDSARGLTKGLATNSTNAQDTIAGGSLSFQTTGVGLSGNFYIGGASANESGQNYVSWTFRKQPKFFDIVTYTGTGVARTIAHNLGSVPACIIVKCTNAAGKDWHVYHTSLGNASYINLNLTSASTSSSTIWNSTTPTSTVFSLGADGLVNDSGDQYVAYLFAHDAGGFGLTGTDNVISCGSYTGNGSTSGPTVTLGYEPQWVLVKRTDSTSNWTLSDNMRGQPVDGATAILYPNSSDAEASATTAVSPTATGFQVKTSGATYNASGGTYIYIAIRRGPMKVPTSGTSVFSPITATSGTQTTGFPVDMQILSYRSGTDAFLNHQVIDRLRGVSSTSTPQGNYLNTTSTAAESNVDPYTSINMSNTGFQVGNNYAGASSVFQSFRRAPSFFDEVCDTGTGVTKTVSHNLTVAPELIIRKTRSTAGENWKVGTLYDPYGGFTGGFYLNTTNAFVDSSGLWNNTKPTSSVFTVSTGLGNNDSGVTYVNYLFATCAGVSKVGSYTGTGTTLQVDCGFTGGARFVLIKRTDSTGDWYVWDSARGIVAGNDPYLLLNSTAAEVTNTDYVDTYSAGFEISSTAPAAINASGGTFIFLAIA